MYKFFKRPNEYNVFNKTFFVKYTPKPLNNKASPILNLSSNKLSNSKAANRHTPCAVPSAHEVCGLLI